MVAYCTHFMTGEKLDSRFRLTAEMRRATARFARENAQCSHNPTDLGEKMVKLCIATRIHES